MIGANQSNIAGYNNFNWFPGTKFNKSDLGEKTWFLQLA